MEKVVLSILTLLVGGGIGYFLGTKRAVSVTVSDVSKSEYDLRFAMNKLWSDHVIWTRQYIVSAIAQLPDADAAAQRLLKNQEDIGNAASIVYGKEAGQELTRLLKEHITIAVDVVKAAIEQDDPALKDADKRWHDNADALAQFLSNANQNWPYETLRKALDHHLALTTQEAVLRLQSKWQDDVANFDKIYDQILVMAGMLSDGIVAQFPDKF